MTPEQATTWREDLEALRGEMREAVAGLGDNPDVNATLLVQFDLASRAVHAIRQELDEEKRLLLSPLHLVGTTPPLVATDPITLCELYALVEEIAWNDGERALAKAWDGLKRMHLERAATMGIA
jgi:hypothetical protein